MRMRSSRGRTAHADKRGSDQNARPRTDQALTRRPLSERMLKAIGKEVTRIHFEYLHFPRVEMESIAGCRHALTIRPPRSRGGAPGLTNESLHTIECFGGKAIYLLWLCISALSAPPHWVSKSPLHKPPNWRPNNRPPSAHGSPRGRRPACRSSAPAASFRYEA
jgi:hypothetical protein